MPAFFSSLPRRFAAVVCLMLALHASAPVMGAEARPADGTSVVVTDALVGEWLVVVEGEKRTRTFVIDAIKAASGDKMDLQASYGWSDSAQVKSAASLSTNKASTTLQIVTPAKSIISATWISADTFEGTFETGTTKKNVSLRKREGGDDDRPSATSRAKKITVLYVGAFNCPSCDEWKRRDQRPEAELMKSIELRQVQTNSYAHIAQESAWPDDLKPIRDRLKLKSGTPRFIVMADDRIVLHRFGKASWQKDVLPKLAELNGARTATK